MQHRQVVLHPLLPPDESRCIGIETGPSSYACAPPPSVVHGILGSCLSLLVPRLDSECGLYIPTQPPTPSPRGSRILCPGTYSEAARVSAQVAQSLSPPTWALPTSYHAGSPHPQPPQWEYRAPQSTHSASSRFSLGRWDWAPSIACHSHSSPRRASYFSRPARHSRSKTPAARHC